MRSVRRGARGEGEKVRKGADHWTLLAMVGGSPSPPDPLPEVEGRSVRYAPLVEGEFLEKPLTPTLSQR